VSELVTITICGIPSRDTLHSLFELAMRDGMGLALQPRQPLPTTRLLPPAKAKTTTRRVVRAKSVAVETPKPATAPPSGRMRPNREVAAARRELVVAKLRGAGFEGLRLKALLNEMRPHLPGTEEQQAAALRNALSDLVRGERVRNNAGQWIVCE
jgi:hypothetical protein